MRLLARQLGLPTLNPGSWLPSLNAPACGNAHCATLATTIWPEIQKKCLDAKFHITRENWKRRLEEECDTCKKALRRSTCVEKDAQR